MTADRAADDEATYDDPALGWPRALVFAIPLRHHLPIAHQSVFLRVYEDNPMPELEGIEMRPTADGPAYPPEFSGRRFVSLRIWQKPTQTRGEHTEFMEAAYEVMKSVADLPPPNRGCGELADWLDYLTVVEAVTVATDESDVYATDTKPDPLTRCIHALVEQVRAYRVSQSAHIPELSYEQLYPFIPFLQRDLRTGRYSDGPSLVTLSHFNFPVPPVMMNEGQLQHHSQILRKLVIGDPLVLFQERRLNAEIALRTSGDFADSCIQSATAAEIMLDSLLGMLLWEESLTDETSSDDVAVEVLSQPTARKVRNSYHSRLGGDWRLEGSGVIADWYSDTAGVRNRVVHRGYRPERDEAEAAFERVQKLMKYVCDLLQMKRRRYPRTTLSFLGFDGLRRRNAWSDDIFGDAVIGPIYESLRQYVDWRDRIDSQVEIRRRTQ